MCGTRLEHLLDCLLVVFDKCLVEKRHLLEVFLHATLNPLGHYLSRLNRLACGGCQHRILGRLGSGNRAFARHQFSWHILARQSHRLHGCNMHCHIFGGGGIASKFHHHPNARAVQIRGQLAASIKALEATKTHVFADFSNQTFAHVFKGGSKAVLRIGQGTQGCNISWMVLGDQGHGGIRQGQETFVFGDKVGLAVDL